MAAATLSADEFVQAFAAHGPSLWVLAAAWVGRSEAEDLVQEAARVAWQRRRQFERGSDARAWLGQIVRHIGANWRRKRRAALHDGEVQPEPVAPPAAAMHWSFDADHNGLSDELASALARLDPVPRACLLLHVVLGHSFDEIAAMLQIPANTASSHARRARLQLRAALPAREERPTTTTRQP